MEPKEHAFGAKRSHVAFRNVPGPLGGKLVEDTLAAADQRLAERPAACTVPWRDAILAFRHDVEYMVGMFEQPCDQRVVDWDRLVDEVFDA